MYEGAEGVETFWKEVLAYIESAYDMDQLERINLNGDGAAWIKAGANMLPKTKFVLDKFHMHKYIISNWNGIQISVKGKDKNIQCSAEGHVSHVFSDRMSSRPLGWSRIGCDRMSRLRVYQKNKGNMLELVRYQKQEPSMEADVKEVIYSASDMIIMENKNKRRLGNMANMPVYAIPYTQIKKIAALKNHIWDL